MPDSLIKLGTITGIHGVHGVVRIHIEENIGELLDPEALFFMPPNGAESLPWFIESIEDGRGDELLVQFEGLTSREEASAYRNYTVWVDQEQVKLHAPSGDWDAWIDFTVFDQHGQRIGKIKEVIDRGPQPLIVIDFGAREILLPLAFELILERDEAKQTVTLQIADGLLELN